MSYDAKPNYLLNPTNSTMQRAIDSFHSFWLPFHSSKDKLLINHYTTLEGLKGILNTRSSWCTDTSSLNDPMELEYGKKLIIDKLNEEIKSEENNTIKKLLDNLVLYVNIFNKHLYRVFIACFCEDDNLLSQWRAYAGKGVGYNIGFNFETDTKFSHNPENLSDESHIILRKIIYNVNEQSKIINRSIAIIIEEAKRVEEYFSNRGGLPEAWPSQAALETVNTLFDIITSFKNPAFREEQEWRLIKVIDPDQLTELLQFRDLNGRLTPYISTLIYENDEDNYFCPISKIRFGPVLDEKITKSNLELFVKKAASSANNIKIKSITISGAGYVLRF